MRVRGTWRGAGVEREMGGEGVIWIASYPKSGNTWVRFLLLNLLCGKQETTERMQTLIPDMHLVPAGEGLPEGNLGMVKTHGTRDYSERQVSRTRGAIYVVRNPIDVLFSNLNYQFMRMRISPDNERYEAERKDYIVKFINRHGDFLWQEKNFGTWDKHIASWLGRENPESLLVVRYEDLKARPDREMDRINDFLGAGKTRAELDDAYRNASFDSMRRIEERETTKGESGFFAATSRLRQDGEHMRFVSRGRAGNGIAELNDVDREQALEAFGPMMERLGYQYDAGQNLISVGDDRPVRPGEDLVDLVAGSVGVGRNEPCPCGSGRRFRQCHGRLGAGPGSLSYPGTG